MKTINEAAKKYYTETVNYPKGVDSIGANSISCFDGVKFEKDNITHWRKIEIL